MELALDSRLCQGPWGNRPEGGVDCARSQSQCEAAFGPRPWPSARRTSLHLAASCGASVSVLFFKDTRSQTPPRC